MRQLIVRRVMWSGDSLGEDSGPQTVVRRVKNPTQQHATTMFLRAEPARRTTALASAGRRWRRLRRPCRLRSRNSRTTGSRPRCLRSSPPDTRRGTREESRLSRPRPQRALRVEAGTTTGRSRARRGTRRSRRTPRLAPRSRRFPSVRVGVRRAAIPGRKRTCS